MKVYIVMSSSDDGYESCLSKVFLNEQKADKYIEIQNEIDKPYYNYYKLEQETYDEQVDLETKTSEYYEYYFGTDENDKITEEDLQGFLCLNEEEYNKLTPEEKKQKLVECNHPDNRWSNDQEKVVKIDEGDTMIKRESYGVTVYSKNSFEEARNIALDLWQKGEK